MMDEDESPADRLARKGAYCLLMGLWTFFLYFNEIHGWVNPPEYPRLRDFLFGWLDHVLQPYYPRLAIAFGVIFLGCSAYYFHRWLKLDRTDGNNG